MMNACRFFKPEAAEKLAVTLRQDDPDWKYVVRHDPKGTGYSFIEIYDEDGLFVSKF